MCDCNGLITTRFFAKFFGRKPLSAHGSRKFVAGRFDARRIAKRSPEIVESSDFLRARVGAKVEKRKCVFHQKPPKLKLRKRAASVGEADQPESRR